MASRHLWPPVPLDICEWSRSMLLGEASGSAASESGVGRGWRGARLVGRTPGGKDPFTIREGRAPE